MLPSGHNPRRLDVLPRAPVAHRLSLSMSFGLIDHARPPAPLAQGPEQAGSLAREMMTRGTATAILVRVLCLRHVEVPFQTTVPPDCNKLDTIGALVRVSAHGTSVHSLHVKRPCRPTTCKRQS